MSDFSEINVLHVNSSNGLGFRSESIERNVDDLGDGELVQNAVNHEQGVVAGGNSTIWGASFNFINSIVGAGIIGISLAIQQCSFILGMILLALVAGLVNRSVVMLIECGVKNNKFDLEDLSEAVLGPFGYYFALVAMILYAYGAQIAYVIIIGDTFPLVMEMLNFQHTILANREFIIAFFAIVVMLPICLQRDLGLLSSTSFMSIFANVILILVIFVAAIHISTVPTNSTDNNTTTPGESPATTTNPHLSDFDIMTLFAGIGSMSFAFVCQHNSFLVFRTLQTPTAKNWTAVANISVITAYVLSLSLGLIGFFTFSPHVQGDLLNNFPVHYVEMTVARGLLGVCMLLTYPMECFVTRHCLLMLIIRWQPYFDRLAAWFERIKQGQRGSSAAAISAAESNHGLQHSDHHHIGSEVEEEGISVRVYSRSSKKKATASSSSSSHSPGYSHRHHLLSHQDDEEEEFEEINFNTSQHQHVPAELILASNNNNNNNCNMTNSFKGPSSASSSVRSRSNSDHKRSNNSPNSIHTNSNTNGNTSRSAVDSTNTSMMNRVLQESMTKFTNFTYFLGDNFLVTPSSLTTTNSSTAVVRNALRRHHNNHDKDNEDGNDSDHDTIDRQKQTGFARFLLDNSSHFEDISPISSHPITVGGQGDVTQTAAYPTISMFTYVMVTLFLWGSTVFIAMMIRDLGVVNSLTGVVAASTIGYTLPGLLYLQTNRNEFFQLVSDYQRLLLFLYQHPSYSLPSSSVISSSNTSTSHHTSTNHPTHRFGYDRTMNQDDEEGEEEEQDHNNDQWQLLLQSRIRSRNRLFAGCQVIGFACFDFRYFVFSAFLIIFGLVLLIMGVITIFINQQSS